MAVTFFPMTTLFSFLQFWNIPLPTDVILYVLPFNFTLSGIFTEAVFLFETFEYSTVSVFIILYTAFFDLSINFVPIDGFSVESCVTGRFVSGFGFSPPGFPGFGISGLGVSPPGVTVFPPASASASEHTVPA
jgi:hypothetical protein